MRNYFATLILIMILEGCSSNTAKSNQARSSESESTGSGFQLYVFEALRHRDTTFLHILEKIPAIEGFKEVRELDYQNYPDNLAGVTDDSKLKSIIIEKINLVLEDSLNVKPFWSKYKITNKVVNENYYQLYFLKVNKQTLEIASSDIIKSHPEKSPYTDQPQLLIEINDEKAKKWTQLTTYAAMDRNGYVAFVIDDEVYSCPSVREPIVVNKIAIPFENLEEAQAISNRIKKSQ